MGPLPYTERSSSGSFTKMISKINGDLGESIAVDFYVANGYKILERNFRSGHNEIDIIALKDDFVVFVEVKTRTLSPALDKYGSAKSAVDKTKRKHLLDAAREYIKAYDENLTLKSRMDVVEIYISKDGDFKKLNYIRSAFRSEND